MQRNLEAALAELNRQVAAAHAAGFTGRIYVGEVATEPFTPGDLDAPRIEVALSIDPGRLKKPPSHDPPHLGPLIELNREYCLRGVALGDFPTLEVGEGIFELAPIARTGRKLMGFPVVLGDGLLPGEFRVARIQKEGE
jgi:hypothetical protein